MFYLSKLYVNWEYLAICIGPINTTNAFGIACLRFIIACFILSIFGSSHFSQISSVPIVINIRNHFNSNSVLL